MRRDYVVLGAAAIAIGLTVKAQDAPADKVNVAFSDPSRPGSVKASLINGGITVRGYDGKEVMIEARAGGSERRRGRRSAESSEGMKRIMVSSTGLSVEEENNVMQIGTSSHSREVNLTIQVPRRTSLKLHCTNGGDIVVENVEGEIEVNNTNGKVTLNNVAGSAVAHALNDTVTATFTRVDPKKAMSFSSLNGKIDVTFPADLKANVRMRTENGDVFSDFDVTMRPDAQQPIVEDSRGKGGRYRVRVDKGMVGTINGGGPEIQFRNHNGAIYIRKAK